MVVARESKEVCLALLANHKVHTTVGVLCIEGSIGAPAPTAWRDQLVGGAPKQLPISFVKHYVPLWR